MSWFVNWFLIIVIFVLKLVLNTLFNFLGFFEIIEMLRKRLFMNSVKIKKRDIEQKSWFRNYQKCKTRLNKRL